MEKLIEDLNNIKGLRVLTSLEKEHIELIKRFEERENLGVLEAINRDYTLLLVHDSEFRNPVSEIVKENNGKLIFPPVPFPEINAKNVVSSSPSKEVHNILKNVLNLNLNKKDATLLVGFDL